ncbi:MAG: aminotransferase class I/II-fold pyridoxal phosphate-dependent enzyme [Acetobacter sp.]
MTVPAIDSFHALSIGALAHRLEQEGRAVIHLEFGQPSTPAPKGAIARAHHVLDTDPMGYWESEPLKERIAAHYAATYGVSVSPGRIVLTCGASAALVLAFSSCFGPGARVALARPGYVAYRNTLRALHIEPVELACGAAERFQLSAARIKALDPAPAGVLVASPANPTGTVLSGQDLQDIARVCRERGVTLLSDEIYHGLTYGEPAHCILEYDQDAIVINSFSKYYSMAPWRLGWLVVPQRRVEAARARMGNMFLPPSALSQHAALAAFDCQDELQAHLATYARNRDLFLQALPQLGLRHIAPPDGAFYIYADIGHLTDDSLGFCRDLLLDTGVATAPGLDFDPVEGGHFIRFSFAASTDRIVDALARMIPWFEARGRRKR